MASDYLRLESINHGTELTELARDLLGQDEMTDVTISCTGGVGFDAHRIVLASASQYFRSIFKKIPSWKHPVVFLRDVRAKDLEHFLHFIYFGEVSVPANELERIIRLGKDLGIRGLEEDKEVQSRREESSIKRKLNEDVIPNISNKIPNIKQEVEDIAVVNIDSPNESDLEDTSELHSVSNPLHFTESTDNEDFDTDLGQDEDILMETSEKDNGVTKLVSSRGYPMIGYKGYRYRHAHVNDKITKQIRWRCCFKQCKGRAISNHDYSNVRVVRAHSHDEPDFMSVECHNVISKLRTSVKNSGLNPKEAIDNVLPSIPEEIRVRLPKRYVMLRRLKKWKEKASSKEEIESERETLLSNELTDSNHDYELL